MGGGKVGPYRNACSHKPKGQTGVGYQISFGGELGFTSLVGALLSLFLWFHYGGAAVSF